VRGAPQNAAGHVFYGVDHSNLHEWNAAMRDHSTPFYYMDNSYFDKTREKYFRVAKNRYQHSGLGRSDCKRFDSLEIPVEPWRQKGQHIIVIEQSDAFKQMMGTPNEVWQRRVVSAIRSLTFRRIDVRHWSRDKRVASGSLEDHLANAHALVTWSSAAAVTALLQGIAVVCFGQCAAEVLSTPLIDIERPRSYSVEDRYNWAGVLAENQFTIDELRNGLAWRTLNVGP
jgi:hypothetical protein